MPEAAANLRQRLKEFDFEALFIEDLGWDRHRSLPLTVSADGVDFALHSVAEKRGMVAYRCESGPDGGIPDYPTRRKIEKRVSRTCHEHIIIYVDAAETTQTWQWVKRELGRPTACREHPFHKGQPGDALIQKLQALAVTIQEEEAGITVVDVAGKARKAFDVDRVTKRFFDLFKKEHDAFLSFIEGITSLADREWYTSLMLNRLMFIYFIQKKGFLDADTDYLRHRLQMMREREGKDRFLTFYRHFLLRLFHEGLGQEEKARKPELDELLGKVPYLNGGLFDEHQLEHDNTQIEIPDDAFERLFNFFDAYQWHLDERPLRAGNEINPDVLGYIFEKYVNQKQMGAYYTKEDITEYISKNTVIPFLFDAAAKECAIAFRPDSALWRLLRDDPDRYIYDAVRKGVDVPLPDEIAAGISDVSKRGGWNRPASEEYALPTETWREHVARRTRCLELRAKLAAGEVHAINDLITYNLNIRQFAQDVIETCEGPELLRAFYHAIEKVYVLDPTCGSGAFLFAALNILEPLYEACLDRMQAFVDDLERSGEPHRPEKFSDFRRVLQQANDTARHPSHRYFILKSIVLNNLYGVDIMEEAVEICKLRLFLKLVAQVETAGQIEPLPDIDFNIRAGNTLVGFTSLDAVRQAMTMGKNGQRRMVSAEDEATLKRIDEDAEVVDRKFDMFRKQQTEYAMDAASFTPEKPELRRSLDRLGSQLDRYLGGEYGVDSKDEAAYARWRKSHQPFHWFVEFYGVVKDGGFDVVIGNPPYVEYNKVKSEYTVRGYETESCGNLYAFMVERSMHLLKSNSGRFGMIVPVSIVSSDRMSLLRRQTIRHCGSLWVSNFAIRPQPLFAEIMQRNSIVVAHMGDVEHRLFSTSYLRWTAAERDVLFNRISMTDVTGLATNEDVIPKVSSGLAAQILKTMGSANNTVSGRPGSMNTSVLYFHDSGESYWTKALLRKPLAYRNGLPVDPAQWFALDAPKEDKPFLYLLLNSNLVYWLWTVYTDCRHMTQGFIKTLLLPRERGVDEKLVTGLTRAYAENTRLFEKRPGYKSPEIKVQKFKPVIDEIDGVLAEHYGFTDEELDFIINYDIKYRMGQDAEAEHDEE